MTWLLKLYPHEWRRRYGAELEELVASQPKSLQLAVDLLGGAVDAHLKPQAFARRLAIGSNPVTEAIGVVMFPGVLAVEMQSMYLRGHSTLAKVVLIGGPFLVLFLIGLLTGLAHSA